MMAVMTDPNRAADVAAVPSDKAPPPDPARYDDPRNVAARRRGLEGPWITGGEDPELAETLRREAPYRRLLIAMVIGIALLGFVLGIIGSLITVLSG